MLSSKPRSVLKISQQLNLEEPLKRPSSPKNNENLENSTTIEAYYEQTSKKISGGPLGVEWVDVDIISNGSVHKTEMYDIMRKENPSLVIRRGRTFRLALRISRPLNTIRDAISFSFFARNDECLLTKTSNGTEQCFPLVYTSKLLPLKKTEWKAICDYVSDEGRILHIQIFVPSKCIVNKWKFSVHTVCDNKDFKINFPGEIFILFNAWCPDDDAFVPSEEEREEYVLSDFGAYYTGTSQDYEQNRWFYSQYEQNMFDYVFYIINLLNIPVYDCWSLLSIVKAFCSENIERLIIDCPWTSNYRGGTNQMKWQGSKLLLEQLFKTKKPVNFGQCYAFNCIIVSIFRALGVASRTVTAFDFYDVFSQKVLIVNKYIKENGEMLEESDQANCHFTWAEVFMKRRDMGHDYDGWQWLNSSGPTSISALRRGELDRPYGTLLAYHSLHPQSFIWIKNNESQKLIQHNNSNFSKIITKSIGDWSPNDISQEYNLSEGVTVNRFMEYSLLPILEIDMEASIYKNEEKELAEITGTMKTPEDLIIGDTIKFQCNINNSGEEKEIEIYARIESILYTGKAFQVVTSKKETTKLNKNYTFKMNTKCDEYLKRLTPELLFRFVFYVSVKDQVGKLYEEFVFKMNHPKLSLQLKDQAEAKKVHGVVAEFIHTPIQLRSTRVTLEEAVNNKNKMTFKKPSVEGRAPVQVNFAVRACKPGKYMVKGTFTTEFGKSTAYLDYDVQ